MKNNNKNKVNELFGKVLHMETIDAFDYLDSLNENPEVVMQVAHLLSDSDTKTAFLATHAQVDNVLGQMGGKANLVGQVVEGIELVELLGKGGMGEVYLGNDIKLQRKVAVKTIRGIYRLNQQARERFHTEALMLSKLNHENICKIYSIIEHKDVDFLVLEYIDGQSLRKNRLKNKTYPEKLHLAKKILSGLKAAHNANIVHRDLKPDNIIQSKSGVIKILDFGISTTLQDKIPSINSIKDSQRKSQKYSTTTPGKVMGTLGYMSPEQAKGEEITTASDIYSLGILYHELFANNHPYPKNIQKDELIKRTKTGKSEPVSGLNKDLNQLINRMKSTIISSRPTAVDCMMILQRIIDKPRRRRKFFLIAALLLLGIISFSKYTYDLNIQKDQALKAKNEAEQMVIFLQGLFENSDPYKNKGEEITARQMLSEGSKRINSELANQPQTLVKLKMTIAEIYRKLGLNESAKEQITQALNIYKTKELTNKSLIMEMNALLATIAFERNNLDEMQGYLDEAKLLAEKYNLTENINYITSQFNYSALKFEKGNYAEAEKEFKKWINYYSKNKIKYSIELISTYNYLALIEAQKNTPEKAFEYLQQAIKLFATSKKNNLEQQITTYGNLATIYDDFADYNKAIEYNLRVIDLRKKILGENHTLLATVYSNISTSYFSINKRVEALEYNRKALNIYQNNKITNSVGYALSLQNKAIFQEPNLKGDKVAEKLFLKVDKILKKSLGASHVNIADNLMSLGINYINQQKYNESEKYLKQAIKINNNLKRPLKSRVFDAWNALAISYKKNNKQKQALELYEKLQNRLNQQEQKDNYLIKTTQENIVALKKQSKGKTDG